MDLLDQLACADIATAMLAQVRELIEQQQAALVQQQAMLSQRQVTVEQQQSKLVKKDFKITALTHELAYLRRICYSKASEVLTG